MAKPIKTRFCEHCNEPVARGLTSCEKCGTPLQRHTARYWLAVIAVLVLVALFAVGSLTKYASNGPDTGATGTNSPSR